MLLQRSGLIGVQGAEGPSGDLGMFEGVLGVIRHENLLGNKAGLLALGPPASVTDTVSSPHIFLRRLSAERFSRAGDFLDLRWISA